MGRLLISSVTLEIAFTAASEACCSVSLAFPHSFSLLAASTAALMATSTIACRDALRPAGGMADGRAPVGVLSRIGAGSADDAPPRTRMAQSISRSCWSSSLADYLADRLRAGNYACRALEAVRFFDVSRQIGGDESFSFRLWSMKRTQPRQSSDRCNN